jgi:hypothetical protein
MNNLVDPVKILLCGDCCVGKTSILRRLGNMTFPLEYNKTKGINVADFTSELKYAATIKISLLDLGSCLMNTQPTSGLFSEIFADVDGIIIVTDASKETSVSKDSMEWISKVLTIAGNTEKIIHKWVIVNKADTLPNNEPFDPHRIQSCLEYFDVDNWSLAVGHSALGDVNVCRGNFVHQTPPEDVLNKLVLSILLKRQSNFCKLIPVPFRVTFETWASLDTSELGSYGHKQYRF